MGGGKSRDVNCDGPQLLIYTIYDDRGNTVNTATYSEWIKLVHENACHTRNTSKLYHNPTLSRSPRLQ